jgi:hypothetical protein
VRSEPEHIMIDDREQGLRMALKAVLMSAQELGIDIDDVTEIAFRLMLNDRSYCADQVGAASSALEAAADALPVIH